MSTKTTNHTNVAYFTLSLPLFTRLTYILNMSKYQGPQINILYEDKDCVVINKPAGIMVHSDGRSKGPFITDWVLEHYPDAQKVGEPARDVLGESISRPGIVHRLDKDTSGALIIAKTKKGFKNLKEQFHDRLTKKNYLAFVWGNMSEEFGTITRSIGRSGNDFRKWTAQRGARGELREAETYWTLVSNFKDENGEKFALINAEPKTGRTHQIRVHLLAENHPVVSDSLYAPKKLKSLGFDRTALHSRSIEFKTTNNKLIKVEADLPTDFSDALHRFAFRGKL